MKNMGFGKLVLADPIRPESDAAFDSEARRMAWNASDVLERRSTAGDLDAALAPFSFVAGTSSRPPRGAAVMSPRSLAGEIDRVLRGEPGSTVALLFGQEDIGLTVQSLARCNVVGSIPSAADYPSLNLSQSALLFLYELRLHLAPGAVTAVTARSESDTLPRREHVDAFYRRLELALDRIGFFQGSSRPHMMRELRSIFNRAAFTSRELAILEGIVHRTLWASRRDGLE
jgi:TrmH family RNA methyltransferase